MPENGVSTARALLLGTRRVVSMGLWLFAFLAALWSGASFYVTYFHEVALREHPDMSAPQLASLAVAAVALPVIPYVLTRAWDRMTRPWGGRWRA